jgi:hypothetical protein
MNDATLIEALDLLGEILADRGEQHHLVLIGGGALLLLGLIERPTQDLDVVARVDGDTWIRAEPLPDALVTAVADVSAALDLQDDWLNAGPTDLLSLGLPDGFEARATRREYGGLVVRIAARVDQISFKLYAATDHWPSRSKHLQDLERLRPTPAELGRSAAWCRTHDPSPGFQLLLGRTLEILESGPADD